jgi:hypothetical protein
MVDKRKVNNIAKGQQTSHKDNLKRQESNLANTNTLLEYKARIIEDGATPSIPAEYKEFLHLF